MGKATGFIDYTRKNYTVRPVAERIENYREFTELQPDAELATQGARCMDCGIPYCHSMGCPVYNVIPEWNDLVYKNKWREAWERLEMTNTLPEITGRICPAPCETACTLSINTSPVTIKQIELAIIEKAWANGWVVPVPPTHETGKRVAVVGSGPAGLSAAQQLRRMGHSVTLFEKNEKIGGLLRYGIPDFKLEKNIIDRRMEQMAAEGVVFETSVAVGTDVSIRYLRNSFDAIVLTMGAGQPRDLVIPGRELSGVHYAMEYLVLSNRFIAGEITEDKIISAKGKNVLVIGGGDTGADCVGTAIRQKAKKVYQYEIMPKPMTWDEPTNPNWPYWPHILRTGTSHEEGCERDWSIETKRFDGKDGTLTEAHFSRVEWKTDPATKKFGPMNVKDSEFSLKVDLVLLAMGFVHVEHDAFLQQMGVTFDPRGNIGSKADYSTSADGVFVAGDAGTGASLVVRAIFHGRQAAESVDAYLAKKK